MYFVPTPINIVRQCKRKMLAMMKLFENQRVCKSKRANSQLLLVQQLGAAMFQPSKLLQVVLIFVGGIAVDWVLPSGRVIIQPAGSTLMRRRLASTLH